MCNNENKCDVISDDDLMFDGLMRFNLKIGWSVIDMFIIMFYGCVPHFPSVPQKFICRLYKLWRSNYLQKVAIIVDWSNYGISQIQNTCLNMKCSVWRVVCGVLPLICVSDTLSRMSHLTNDDGALNEVGCFLFACKLWMCVYFFRHASGFISMIIKKAKIVKVENMKLTFISYYDYMRKGNCWHLILRLR